MEHMKLISESFETAAYALRSSLDEFNRRSTFSSDVDRFCAVSDSFKESIDRLIRMNGMVAENDIRKLVGMSPAYDEKAFLEL